MLDVVAALANISIMILAAGHLLFAYREAIQWPRADPASLPFPPGDFTKTAATFAKNVGIYNLLVAVGLVLSCPAVDRLYLRLFHPDTALFLCIAMTFAGLYGGFTSSRKIFVYQALPALLASVFVIAAMVLKAPGYPA